LPATAEVKNAKSFTCTPTLHLNFVIHKGKYRFNPNNCLDKIILPAVILKKEALSFLNPVF
jgi:hypothetical protein